MILELKEVNAFYGESHILFDVALEVEEGNSVCILGRNGVGKSTTMKSIAGQINARNKCHVEGSILFSGTELVGMPAYKISRKGMAYVPQGRHIFPNLTVKENLQIAEPKTKTDRKEWTLESIYKLFPRLEERSNSWGRNLSGGEQQMLTIARGLMQNPTLLILDEITEGLAPIVVKQLVQTLNELREHSVTILLAEQNVHFALAVSTKCYIMEKGNIVYSGSSDNVPTEVMNKYLGA
ncbi:MAG TPA: ABC transporter ATP-binding protein [Negativicutes bacterium]|nr:ABC transporter ATP-binding protein [Negativicutes bacterium]